ncbi:uncharacterized protein EI90DRAFT_3063131 [Cantharellus anzutake]|uniref:uncharacterized protein n=1 Tax=Cantharellus anzutake TaxID=1750568 RepID=UPI001904644A|nr:uncharacterized protein EI90DRAFT_3063131 [Cantharellus anzutake]KAF8329078.1 hypothetical protein EI90DRAFT_3063131 [Cantharellus anzutake]
MGGSGPETTLKDLLAYVDPGRLRVLRLRNEWLERMDWMVVARYTNLESLEVGCAGETLIWSIEEDSDFPVVHFNRLLKLTLHGIVSGCLIPPMLRAELLRHLCMYVDYGTHNDIQCNLQHSPHFPNLQSCILRIRWGFPADLLKTFLNTHTNLVAIELPLCHLGVLQYLERQSPASSFPLRLLRLRITDFDMAYIPEDHCTGLVRDLTCLCEKRMAPNFALQVLCSTHWRPKGLVAEMLCRARAQSYWIPCEEECTGIPAEDLWNCALLDRSVSGVQFILFVR